MNYNFPENHSSKKGSNSERLVEMFLSDAGWYTFIAVFDQHSPIDVICMRGNELKKVQVKSMILDKSNFSDSTDFMPLSCGMLPSTVQRKGKEYIHDWIGRERPWDVLACVWEKEIAWFTDPSVWMNKQHLTIMYKPTKKGPRNGTTYFVDCLNPDWIQNGQSDI